MRRGLLEQVMGYLEEELGDLAVLLISIVANKRLMRAYLPKVSFKASLVRYSHRAFLTSSPRSSAFLSALRN